MRAPNPNIGSPDYPYFCTDCNERRARLTEDGRCTMCHGARIITTSEEAETEPGGRKIMPGDIIGLEHHQLMLEKKVVVHPVTAKKVALDLCPKCGGELDTGWECNDCGFDAIGFVELER